ncbi:MAG: hypothetical protein JRI59_10295 [Deltaproteobacteria bacterium]|nr:hypothetical protein [Deltaproteobacteria bacterium]
MMLATRRFFLWVALAMVLMAALVVPGSPGRAGNQDFPGEVVKAAVQTIAPGGAELVVVPQVPEGFQWLKEAPMQVKVTSQDQAVVSFGGKAVAGCRQPRFPWRVRLRAQPGETRLQVDLILSYCKKGKGGLCITKQVRLNLPVKVEAAAQNRKLRAAYKPPAL